MIVVAFIRIEFETETNENLKWTLAMEPSKILFLPLDERDWFQTVKVDILIELAIWISKYSAMSRVKIKL